MSNYVSHTLKKKRKFCHERWPLCCIALYCVCCATSIADALRLVSVSPAK